MNKKIKISLLFLTVSAVLVFFTLKGLSFERLDTCFQASVSKKTICKSNSDYVPLSRVSSYFLDAVVMSEDDSFYFHDGFDWKELRKSFLANLRKFSFVRGGSTITQQLVKNVYLTQEKSITRKLKEAYIAHQIEKKHSKKLILEKYVNAIEFGKDIWGIKQAANFYFRKPPADLELLESLYLVVLLPSPVKYSQSYFDGKLTPYQLKRIKTLLKRFVRRAGIDAHYAAFLKEQINQFPWREPLVYVKPEVADDAEKPDAVDTGYADSVVEEERVEADAIDDEIEESFEDLEETKEEEEESLKEAAKDVDEASDEALEAESESVEPSEVIEEDTKSTLEEAEEMPEGLEEPL